MRHAVWLVPALLIIVFSLAAPATAKPEYTRRTSKDCSFCHMPPGYNLNEAGQYYKEHQHSLKGYVPPGKPRAAQWSVGASAFRRTFAGRLKPAATGYGSV